jgi:apolipoprotein N-acyltransferase
LKNKKILRHCLKHTWFIIFLIGAISSFGFAPFHFFPLTIVSYVLLIYFFKDIKKEKKNIFLYAFLFSLGKHIGLLYPSKLQIQEGIWSED